MKRYPFIFLFAILILGYYHPAHAQIVTNYAGNGGAGYTGDGGYAIAARLNIPEDVAIDDSGNVYIAAYWDYAIRKVNRAGIITTIAGTGTSGFTGDGGPATAARLYGPASVATDHHHNIYIADINNARIRKINAAGIITTIAGTGVQGYNGDGIAATAAQLNWPQGVAVDTSGNVYIADEVNNRIRKIDTAGIITTVAGNGVAAFSGDDGPATAASLYNPTAMVPDNIGNLYIVDYYNDRIRKVSPSGIITTFAGSSSSDDWAGDGGPASLARLSSPSGIALDNAGNIYIGDGGNNRIRKVNTSGIISTIAGNGLYGYSGDGGPAILAELSPEGLRVDGVGNIYFADLGNNRVRKVNGISGTINLCTGSSSTLSDEMAGGTWVSSAPGIASIDAATGIVTSVAVGTATVYYIIDMDTASTPVTVVDTLPYAGAITGSSILCLGDADTLTDTSPGGVWSAANTVVTISDSVITGITTGTDTIFYTITNACGTQSANLVVTVNGATAGTITGPASMCQGDTIVLADTVSGGVWTSNNTLIATVASGGAVAGLTPGLDVITYTVTTMGCSTAISYPVAVFPLPDAGVIAGSNSICPGDSITLVGSAAGGTWTSSNPAVITSLGGGMITGVAPGNDTISYIVTGADCTAKVTFPMLVKSFDDCRTGIAAAAGLNHNVVAYPNPSTGSFTVDIPYATQNTIITLSDLYGKTIGTKESGKNTGSVQFDISGMPPGIYLLKVQNNKDIQTQKIILE